DAKPRLVHHREHRVEAAVFLADQPTDGAIVIHDAGRAAVYAHLFFDRATADGVAASQGTVLLDENLGHHEKRDALGTHRGGFDAREHQMDDVVGQVVLACRDEYLGAADFVAAVRLLHCP